MYNKNIRDILFETHNMQYAYNKRAPKTGVLAIPKDFFSYNHLKTLLYLNSKIQFAKPLFLPLPLRTFLPLFSIFCPSAPRGMIRGCVFPNTDINSKIIHLRQGCQIKILKRSKSIINAIIREARFDNFIRKRFKFMFLFKILGVLFLKIYHVVTLSFEHVIREGDASMY